MENGPVLKSVPLKIVIFRSYINVYQRVVYTILTGIYASMGETFRQLTIGKGPRAADTSSECI